MLSLHLFWLVLVLSLTSPREVEAQFPRACTTPEALNSRTCCPLFNGSVCGFSSGKGICLEARHRYSPRPLDYRVDWPRYFYDAACNCSGNYDGFDCSQCLPGWRGPQCKQRHNIERKEITDMTDSERETFFSSLHKAKQSHSSRYMILRSNDTRVEGNYVFHNTTIYNMYVWMHYYSAKRYEGYDTNSAHKGPAFVFWHQVFLLFIEREIRELTGNQDFYIPYWDWTRTNHCNICTNQYFEGVGKKGRIDSNSLFSNWTITCPYRINPSIICEPSDDEAPAYLIRNPGKNPKYSMLPTTKDVEDTLAQPEYDTQPYNRSSKTSFRNTLEGYEFTNHPKNLKSSMHNLVHQYFNGTMTAVVTADNDPIFMVHHSFVDKLFHNWYQDHRNATYPDAEDLNPAQRVKSFMAPFFPLRTNDYFWGTPITEMGYKYKMHSAHRPGAGSRAARHTAGFQEESATRWVQWQWPVLGVLSIALLCASIGAATKCKGPTLQSGLEGETSTKHLPSTLPLVAEGRRASVESTERGRAPFDSKGWRVNETKSSKKATPVERMGKIIKI